MLLTTINQEIYSAKVFSLFASYHAILLNFALEMVTILCDKIGDLQIFHFCHIYSGCSLLLVANTSFTSTFNPNWNRSEFWFISIIQEIQQNRKITMRYKDESAVFQCVLVAHGSISDQDILVSWTMLLPTQNPNPYRCISGNGILSKNLWSVTLEELRVYRPLTIKSAAIRSDLNFTNRERNGVAWDMVMALFAVLEAVSDVKKISLNMLAFAGGTRYTRRGTLATVQCEVCVFERVIKCTILV